MGNKTGYPGWDILFVQYVSTEEEKQDAGGQKIDDHQRNGRCPYIIRFLIGPAGQQMNEQSVHVTVEDTGLPPKNIHHHRDEGEKCNAQISQPRLSVTHRGEAKAVKQAADGDG